MLTTVLQPNGAGEDVLLSASEVVGPIPTARKCLCYKDLCVLCIFNSYLIPITQGLAYFGARLRSV